MNEGPFDDALVEIACPGCGDRTSKTLRWYKANDEWMCPSCGIGVDLDGDDVRAGLKGTEQALLDLSRAIARAFDKPKEWP